MAPKFFQDYYPDKFAHCYGCGRLNPEGLQIKSYWEGEDSVCRYTPKLSYTGGFPGYIYGGLIASLIDCHSAATASAAALQEKGFSLGDRPLSRFVTAKLYIDFLKPTPMGRVLELRGRIKEIAGRKVVVNVTLSADDEIRAKGEVVLVRIPDN